MEDATLPVHRMDVRLRDRYLGAGEQMQAAQLADHAKNAAFVADLIELGSDCVGSWFFSPLKTELTRS